jgi:hypothetical protein
MFIVSILWSYGLRPVKRRHMWPACQELWRPLVLSITTFFWQGITQKNFHGVETKCLVDKFCVQASRTQGTILFYFFFNNALSQSVYIQRQTIGWLVTSHLETMWQDVAMAQFKALNRNLSRGIKENHEKSPSVKPVSRLRFEPSTWQIQNYGLYLRNKRQ